MTAPRSAERAIQVASSLIDLARIENQVPPTIPRQLICFDEWNVWSPTLAPGELGAEQAYNLSDALAVAIWLNVFVRQAQHVGMANIAQSVNVISPLTTSKTGLMRQTIWWPLLLFSKYMRGHTIAANVRCGEYEGPTEPAWIRGTIETPWLDVSAVLGDDGFVNVVIVNIHESSDFKVDLEGVSENVVQTFKVTGDLQAINDHENERIGLTEGSWDGKGPFEVGAHSINLLRWKA
jgi:alpha-L-arabinofuranosidase